jgi:hypothetical protein
VLDREHRCGKAGEPGESLRLIREELRGMRLRGSAKDKSGRSVRVSGVTVSAGLVGCQGPVEAEGRMGTEGEHGGERGVGSRLGCVSGCSQCWFASMGLASACVLCPYFTCRCLGQGLVNVSQENNRDPRDPYELLIHERVC